MVPTRSTGTSRGIATVVGGSATGTVWEIETLSHAWVGKGINREIEGSEVG